MRWREIVLAGFLLLAAVRQTKATTLDGEKALVGVRGINVSVVVWMPSNALESSAIQTDVELRLRQSGIRVLTDKEYLAIPESAMLSVNIDGLKLKDAPLYAYNIAIEVIQELSLPRRPAVKTLAITWNRSNVGVVGEGRLGSIRDDVRDYVDEFLNTYLTVNPRR